MGNKLYKSRQDKMISGVCGGLAKYFGIESWIIRLAMIALTFATGGVMFVIYILMAALIPYEPLYHTDGSYNYYSSNMHNNGSYNTHSKESYDFYNNTSRNEANFSDKVDSVGKFNIGLFLIIIGLVIFFGKIIPGFFSTYFIPLLLIVFGIMVIISSVENKNQKPGGNDYKKNSQDINYNMNKDQKSSYNASEKSSTNSKKEPEEDIIIDVEEDRQTEQKVENGEGI